MTARRIIQFVFAVLAAGLSTIACKRETPVVTQPAWQAQSPPAPAPADPPAQAAPPEQDAQAHTKPSELFAHVLGTAGASAVAAPPIDPETARGAIRELSGVRSVTWLDQSNLLVRIGDAQYRSDRFIDDVCNLLRPLGDTSTVLVHLQNAAARSSEGMETLSRGCQPASSGTARAGRDVDVLDPALRTQQHAETERLRHDQPRKQSKGDRAALEAIPEM